MNGSMYASIKFPTYTKAWTAALQWRSKSCVCICTCVCVCVRDKDRRTKEDTILSLRWLGFLTGYTTEAHALYCGSFWLGSSGTLGSRATNHLKLTLDTTHSFWGSFLSYILRRVALNIYQLTWEKSYTVKLCYSRIRCQYLVYFTELSRETKSPSWRLVVPIVFINFCHRTFSKNKLMGKHHNYFCGREAIHMIYSLLH